MQLRLKLLDSAFVFASILRSEKDLSENDILNGTVCLTVQKLLALLDVFALKMRIFFFVLLSFSELYKALHPTPSQRQATRRS